MESRIEMAGMGKKRYNKMQPLNHNVIVMRCPIIATLSIRYRVEIVKRRKYRIGPEPKISPRSAVELISEIDLRGPVICIGS